MLVLPRSMGVPSEVVASVPRTNPEPGGTEANPASKLVIVAEPPLKSNCSPSAATELFAKSTIRPV